jgi:hypothetical protein
MPMSFSPQGTMKRPEGRSHAVRFRWVRLAIPVLLILIGAVCLLKYMGWAGVVSALNGLPSHASTVAMAARWGLVYFWGGLLAEVVLVVYLGIRLKLDAIDLEGAPKVLARGIIALAIAGVGTLGAAFLLNCIGKLLGWPGLSS